MDVRLVRGRQQGALALLLLLIAAIQGYGAIPANKASVYTSFEDHIAKFLDKEEYDGAAIGVVQNRRLIYAKGFGSSPDGDPMTVNTQLPVSSLSKTLTALAVLKLVEDGDLYLSDRVFGKDGILYWLNLDIVDERMLDITVGHLLQHAGGWDEGRGPLFDPMLNNLFIARGYNIESIEESVPKGEDLTHEHIIRYVARQPLAFAPGTRIKYSNFGYCVLGRVIEEIADLDYDIFVRHHVLRPAGMMRTRIGDSVALPVDMVGANDATLEIDSQLLHGLVDPFLLDSTLGWYSTLEDVARLAMSLSHPTSGGLLKEETLQLMFRRPPPGVWSNQVSWYGAGLHVQNDGAFWQESDRFDNDGIVYHPGMRAFGGNGGGNKTDLDLLLKGDITIIMLMTNNKFKKLKSAAERLVPYIKQWPLNQMADKAVDNLADARVLVRGQEFLIRFHLPEQQLAAYTNALRLSQYAPLWLHAYNHDMATFFTVISHRVYSPGDLHYRLEVSNHPHHLRRRIHHWQDTDGYKVALLQEYVSTAHYGDVTHVALLSRSGHPDLRDRDTRWALNIPLRSYLDTVDRMVERGFAVSSQSVTVAKGATTVDYILTDGRAAPENREFNAYHDLSLSQLERVAKTNALKEFCLQHLDTHVSATGDNSQPRFSAVFVKRVGAKWALQMGVKGENVVGEAENWAAKGYMPKLLVGYKDGKELRYAALWVM